MYDVIVIGTGPSGLMAAISVDSSKKVLVLEKNSSAGKKLLLTGGGRCNVTNLKSNNLFLDEVNYNKKYLYSVINNFGPKDVYNFFTNNGVLLKEEEDNKIFPVSNKSNDILNCLLKKVVEKNISIKYNSDVLKIVNGDIKQVITKDKTYETLNIIIATGGVSFKNTGSNGSHMLFAKMLNQPTTKLFPCEVGIILKNNLSVLAGTSLSNVTIKYLKYKTTGNLIYTHKGLSGTSIMKMSEHIYLNNEKIINIDLLSNYSLDLLLSNLNNFDKEKEITSFLNCYFSKKYSLYILSLLNIESNTKIKNINNYEKEKIINLIKNISYEVLKVDDINNAYVTGGGIDLNYINTKTMESKINKGIYFVGESLDIHGPIGGYNITLSLATGYTAGINIK